MRNENLACGCVKEECNTQSEYFLRKHCSCVCQMCADTSILI